MKKLLVFLILIGICLVGCKKNPEDKKADINQSTINDNAKDNPVCDQEKERKIIAEKYDYKNLLYSGNVVSDSDTKMLEIPKSISDKLGKDFIVVKTPPKIDFGIVPVEPRFLKVYNNQAKGGWWGNYSQFVWFTMIKEL